MCRDLSAMLVGDGSALGGALKRGLGMCPRGAPRKREGTSGTWTGDLPLKLNMAVCWGYIGRSRRALGSGRRKKEAG